MYYKTWSVKATVFWQSNLYDLVAAAPIETVGLVERDNFMDVNVSRYFFRRDNISILKP